MAGYIRSLIFIAALAIVAGCEDMLEPKADSTYSSEDTWRLSEKARGVLYNAYAAITNKVDMYDDNFLDCATSDAVTNDFESDVYALAYGSVTSASNPLDIWNTAYAQFKNIHLFLENGLNDNVRYSVVSDDVDLKYKRKYKGEAFFLRAWWGWQLLRLYGGKTSSGEVLGYPIVLNSSDGYDMKARDTYEDCVERIIEDLDSALVYLPEKYTGNDPITGTSGQGRASGNAALALKAIVYLFAASDAYQPDGITEGERRFKWIRTVYAADVAMSHIGKTKPLSSASFGGNSNNVDSEFLLAMSTGNSSDFESRNYVTSYYGRAITNPSQNLADAFPMANGYPITDSRSGYDGNNPYEGRDPRFYLNFYYNGAAFQSRTIDIFEGGIDSITSDERNTRTGYYLRKWIVETCNLTPGNAVSAHRYNPLIRKTEVYMAFAEAANQIWGPYGTDPKYVPSGRTAYSVMQELREGAGITGHEYMTEVADAGKEAFDAFIMNERRIEFSFENRRWFDLRRNMMLDEMSEPVRGVDVTKTDDGGFRYEEKIVEDRHFEDPKYVYSPIPYGEIAKNPLLEQNVGW